MATSWDESVESHRREVREAIVRSVAGLVAEGGLRSVTMARVAAAVGLSRATLYKYFTGVEPILLAWHQERISSHVQELARARDRVADPAEKLVAVLEAYALLSRGSHGHQDPELVAFFHRDAQVTRAQGQVHAMIRDLVAEAAGAGALRDDVSSDELAGYCLHALSAAARLPSKAAIDRLVSVTIDGLRPR